MADEFPPKDIDIDEQALAIMKEHHRVLEDLRERIEKATSYGERRRLRGEFLNECRRQQATFSEVPGLEDYARRLAAMIEQFEKAHGF